MALFLSVFLILPPSTGVEADCTRYHSTHYEVNHDPRGPIVQAIEGLAGSMTSFLSGLAEFPMDVVNSFSQDLSARFADSYGLSTWDARASVTSTACTGADSTSTTVVPTSENQTTLSERAGSASDQSSASNESQNLPAMGNKQRSKGRTLIANTSYTGRRVLNWIVELPMGLTLGLSQGFHEVPRWYHDRTVRETPQVRGFWSGIDAAKKVCLFTHSLSFFNLALSCCTHETQSSLSPGIQLQLV